MTMVAKGRHGISVGARSLFLVLLVALVASGCSSSGPMIKAQRISEPPQGKALVTFVRPSAVGGAVAFGIWDSGSLVGVLNSGTCIQYEATPGEHYFLGRAENWSCVKADLAAGRHYVVKANPVFGVWKARLAFDPVTAADYGKQLKDVQKWLAQLQPMIPDPQQVETYSQPRRTEVLAAQATFESGQGRYEILAAQDCLPQ
jgi:hypothetical protein